MDCEPDLKLPILFIHDPSQHLKCPVCLQLYTEPVINIVCGHTFCKACAQNTSTCPTDGSACDPKQVVVNRLVIGQIEDLLIYCRYGLVRENEVYVQDPSGCQQKIHLGARTEHESSCQFRYVDCSNSSCSARLRQSELVEHLKTCQHATCQYRGKGCEFESRTEEVVEHEATCGYRGLQAPAGSGDLQTMENRARDLEDTNRQLQNQVNTLNTRVQQLEDNNTGMQAKLEEYHGGMMDLKSKCESLSAAIEQLMTVRSRRSIGSPAHMAEGRPRSASNKVYPDQTAPQELSDKGSFRKSGSPPSTGRYTKWEMPFQFKCIGTLRGHQDVVWCMVAKDRKLYTAGSDCLVKVWDLENLQRGCVKTIPGHTKAIQCMAMGGNYLYTGGHDSSICCWNLEDFTCVNSVQNAHDNIISAMVIAGDYLFTSSFSLIKIWEAGTLTMKDTITGLHHWVRALTLNPERDKLFSGSHNTINIWSVVEPFGLKGKVDHQFGSVHSLAITDKYIIAGTYNRNVHVFRLSTYEHVTALKGHIGVVTSVVASYCGGFCISCSSDQTIKIWNLENMLPTQTLQRHEGSVNTLVLYNDFLFSGSEDKEIKVFMYFQMQMGFAIKP